MAARLVPGFLFAILLLLPATAFAFNGARKGFVLGLGAGGHFSRSIYQGRINWTFVDSLGTPYGSSYSYNGHRDEGGVYTDIKLGYGITDQFVLHYDSRVSWFDGLDGWSFGVASIGLSYYLRPQARSTYVASGFGFGTQASSGGNGSSGPGVFTALGYEFAKHWALELGLDWGKPADGFQVLSSQLSLNVLAY